MIGKLAAGSRWMFVLFILVAGLSKLFHLSAFRDSLDTWVRLPQLARAPVAVLVPTMEVGLSVIWLFQRKTSAYLALGAMVGIFTAVYLAHVLIVEPPQCNCTVKLAAFASWHDTVAGILVRNAVFVLLWALGLVYVLKSKRERPKGDCDANLSPQRIHAA